MSGEVSSVSNETANVRFFNATRQNVEVVWVNFSGRRQRYATLPEGASVDINTYVNHVWVFHETVTDIQYLANGQLHFRVKPTQHPCPAFRQMVRITHPLFSLRQIACISVRSQLPLFLAKRPRIPVPYKPYEDENNEEVNIIFKNMTEGDVSLIWLAPGGYQVLYRLIGRKHLTLYSKTVVGHMWVAESPDNGARLLVGGKTAYAAEKSADQEQTPLIEIRAPVYSLAELAGMRVRQDVYLSKTPVKLDLPVTVLRELDRGLNNVSTLPYSTSRDRLFQCEVYNRIISQKPHLDSHIKTHTGERSFKCGLVVTNTSCRRVL